MKAFINSTAYVPLYPISTDRAAKLCDMPPGAIVTHIETQGEWSAVFYKTNLKTWHGYTRAGYVEEWIEPERHDVIRIRNATPNESDFAQNLVYLNNVQFNLCGQFSVLFCAGWDEFDIETWLEDWGIKQPTLFKRIFAKSKSQLTGIPDLASMLRSFEGYDIWLPLAELFKYRGTPLFTPARLETVLTSKQLIIGCKIERQFGRLAASGVPHWVVIDAIQREGRGGIVELYNPASNSVEKYTWEQIVSSCTRSPYGLAVAR